MFSGVPNGPLRLSPPQVHAAVHNSGRMNPLQARNQRKELNLSQVRLAKLAGVSRYRYVLWELDNGPLTLEELQRVGDALRRRAKEQIQQLAALSLHST